jgi:hypothetical protein
VSYRTAPLTVGTTIADRYRIDAQIGAGGMATVYRATDTRYDRAVAVKVLGGLSPGADTARFVREIRIAAQLTHPHILPLTDSGDVAGALYYVMPFIEGDTLRARLARDGELPLADAVRILRHVLDALGYAHGHDVVHRDVKPENILLGDGHALVADFGVARALGAGAASAVTAVATAIGAAVGTPAYMSPEQVAGEPADHRADIYAIGVVAYEMLTGRLPFEGGTAQQIMTAHLTAAASDVRRHRTSIPPRLASAVMRCLEKRPADRWQRAADLVAELDATDTERHATPAPAVGTRLIEREFVLSERICRKLNRATLDPRIIGDTLTYVDNQLRSDVLVCFLHGLGLDHRDFGPVLEQLPYGGLSPTLYGCAPERRLRPSLSLDDHVIILREWLRDAIQQRQPSIVVIVGFSLGADMGFDLIAAPDEAESPPIHAFIAFDPNLSLDTCFVSRVLAGITPDRPDALLADLQRLGGGASTLKEWLQVHAYLVRVLRKFESDAAVLQRAAADIVRPLAEEQKPFEVFAHWLKAARARHVALRLVFSDAPSVKAALGRLRLANLDGAVLGEDFPYDDVTIVPETDHFDLMRADRQLAWIEELVARVRAKHPSQ